MNNSLTGLIILFAYFGILCLIGFFTGKKNSNDDFFRAGRRSPWFVVAFGMIGVSLSGVTFLSVSGSVVKNHFSYMELVLGNMVGYWVMALMLLPLYYKLNLTSIYGYLNERFGRHSYRTGAFCFLLSRTVGASLRLFLVAVVLHNIVFKPLFTSFELPFAATAFVSILLIWLYTFKGGIKTVVWTDTLQTLFLLFALAFFIIKLPGTMGSSFSECLNTARQSGLTQISSGWATFLKSFVSGIFLTIVMNGLDQDMMQKNLTCSSLRSSQKNIFSFSILFVLSSFAFLVLGAFLTLYVQKFLPQLDGDKVFPGVIEHLATPGAFIVFILGVVAAAYSSADSALASLTTSFCVDFADIESKSPNRQVSYRRKVHIAFSVVLFLVVCGFHQLGNNDVVWTLFKAMGYTYGPLLGLFAFGILLKRQVNDKRVPWIAIAGPLCSYALNAFLAYKNINLGLAILLVNGLICFGLCYIFSSPPALLENKRGR
ncbi:MAG: sodium:solute symporter [Kiritimatiellales bacterium]|nr:sodium:solute symporter [Kiritimatiellales bacterium]